MPVNLLHSLVMGYCLGTLANPPDGNEFVFFIETDSTNVPRLPGQPSTN